MVRLVGGAALVGLVAAEEFPRACSAYIECQQLQGDCCPTAQSTMLDCCVQGSIRMNKERLERRAKEEQEAAKGKIAAAQKEKKEAQAKADAAAAYAKKEAERAKAAQAKVDQLSQGATEKQKEALAAKAKAD